MGHPIEFENDIVIGFLRIIIEQVLILQYRKYLSIAINLADELFRIATSQYADFRKRLDNLECPLMYPLQNVHGLGDEFRILIDTQLHHDQIQVHIMQYFEFILILEYLHEFMPPHPGILEFLVHGLLLFISLETNNGLCIRSNSNVPFL